MQKKKNGYLMSFDEYNYILNTVSMLRNSDIKSIQSSREMRLVLNESENIPDITPYVCGMEGRSMVVAYFLDMIKNILGNDDLFEAKNRTYDIVGYVEQFVENVNEVLERLHIKTFEVRKKFSGENEIVFNDYKMRAVILNLIKISMYDISPKRGVLYLSDNGGDSIQISTVSDNSGFCDNDKTSESGKTAEELLRSATALKLSEEGGFMILKRFAAEMNGEFIVAPFRGKTKYTVSVPKEFDKNSVRDCVSYIQFSMFEIEQFFGVVQSLHDNFTRL